MAYDTNRIPELLSMADSLGVKDIAEEVLNDPRFAVWTASHGCNKHHYGKGGLQQHTWEVVVLCMNSVFFHQEVSKEKVDKRTLFLAALFHDIGKLWDYEPYTFRYDENEAGDVPDAPDKAPITDNTEWWSTIHKRKIHHISRSVMVWQQAIAKYPKYTDIGDEVIHCILSHHGLRDWGSPVMPKSREAWILHHCDCLSARMNDCDGWDQVKK